jgi:hypothetical protein
MLMSCPFCGTGTDLPHDTQKACIAALHSEISHIRRVVEHLNRPAFAEAPAGEAPAFAGAPASQAKPNDISGDNPNPQLPRDRRG